MFIHYPSVARLSYFWENVIILISRMMKSEMKNVQQLPPGPIRAFSSSVTGWAQIYLNPKVMLFSVLWGSLPVSATYLTCISIVRRMEVLNITFESLYFSYFRDNLEDLLTFSKLIRGLTFKVYLLARSKVFIQSDFIIVWIDSIIQIKSKFFLQTHW